MPTGWTSLVVVLAAPLALGAAAPSPKPAKEPSFAVVVATGTTRADGSATEEPCLAGRFAAGERVVLLASDAPVTCVVRSGAVVAAEKGDEACTLLPGVERCPAHHWDVAAIGAEGREYRRTPLEPLSDAAALERLARRVAEAGALAAPLDPSVACGGPSRPIAIEDAPARAYRLAGVAPGPTFVRYRARFDGATAAADGPLVVVEEGVPVGPVRVPCAKDATGFRLDGRDYVHLVWHGCDCGWLMDEVRAVERGTLRQVLATTARSM